MPSMGQPSARLVLAALLLLGLGARGAEASCARVNNPELVEYSCEGGSVEDLLHVPADVEKLRISGMPVRRLGEAQLARFSKLLVFACSHCQIADVEDGAFRRLEDLQQLSLDNNQLTEVRAGWLEGLAYLTYLDLNYNSIERIEPEVFQGAPDLVDLRLSGNRLVCLDLEALSRLRDLKRVFINENPTFACPNALKRFLSERRVDFEADPQWATMSQDRVRASEPLQQLQSSPSPMVPPTFHPRGHWTPEPPRYEEEPTPAARPPVYAPPPEMIQPSVPEQDFPLQGPFYTPKVSQQQLENYRNSLAEQAQNASEAAKNRGLDALANATLAPNVLLAGHQPQHPDGPSSTECPNAATRAPLMSLLLLLCGLVLQTAAN
ncbi:chondroadherin-like [Copidosoma floridanum]|uniref:chondroadherin-like n=1 Tax=Copidosoma floridanum TaxID=29053 RepID=UPI0006C97FEF|nr:chondroadherin-like [Copidosoma floridanum]